MSEVLQKIGDWEKVGEQINQMGQRFLTESAKALRLVAELTDRAATLHIQNQDLPWKPLSPEFKDWKKKKGYSTHIYIMTSTYSQSIAIEVDERNLTARVGVLRPVPVKDSPLNTIQLGYVLEFGSVKAKIPARPLWRPVFEEMKPVAQKHFENVVKKTMWGGTKHYGS